MCGIFFLLTGVKILEGDWVGKNENSTFSHSIAEKTKGFLKKRGPDSFEEKHFYHSCGEIFLMSSVLHLRGDFEKQPYIEGKNFFCFNGEIFNGSYFDDERNDGRIIFTELCKCKNENEICEVLSKMKGPFSFVFANLEENIICVSKDVLGRRSLLFQYFASSESIAFSSIADSSSSKEQWREMPIDHVLFFTLSSSSLKNFWNLHTKSWSSIYQEFNNTKDDPFPLSKRSFFFMNNNTEEKEEEMKAFYCSEFLRVLKDSVKRRLFCKSTRQRQSNDQISDPFHFGILFSGGIDSLFLSILCCLCIEEKKKEKEEEKEEEYQIDLLNINFGEKDSSDRKLGKAAFLFLKKRFPSVKINLILVNKTKEEVKMVEPLIIQLMYPCDTVLDLSLSTALFFASQGKGIDFESGKPKHSKCRILFSGLGADELMAGYGRHRTKFTKNEGENRWKAMNEEMEMDVHRLWLRNLGRDDRVMSSHGKEIRFPFLDLSFIKLIRFSIPLNVVCDLSLERGIGDKKILRTVVSTFSKEMSLEKKRAIQFGSNCAKVCGKKKQKGSDKVNAPL